ncbi:SUMF1/EgtB/PvdO family nonheme iron enzyme [Streptomyces sp. CA-243310]|uniref:SUMF1/EgtB/PvdO family nonheme iron enzyme n=1 Tax=Streptomyces sp. CA-243310 TaxID=3240056 RepID=UPI003D94922F
MWEWSADRFAADGPERAMRGGSHLCHDSYGNRHHVAARTRTRSTPNSSAGDIGFRVAADVHTAIQGRSDPADPGPHP